MPAIQMKEAVARAKQFAMELYEGDIPDNLALEEIEFDEHNNTWKVTLGYDSSNVIQRSSAVDFFGSREEERKRSYKLFTIHGDSGELLSMKIRSV